MKTFKVDKDIFLKEIALDDAEEIFKTIDSQREYLGEWLPFVEKTKGIKDTEDFVNSVINEEEEKRELIIVIFYKDNFTGIIGFKDTDKENKKTEIGYWLSEKYQKLGIISRSLKVLLKHSFEEKGINRVQIKCAVKNEKSIKIPKRLNFKFEGIERDGELLSNNKFTDLEVYSLLKSEWKTN
ncbi:MAG: GNAT family N-acetyltransferase [Bacteroidales bacterium]|nr:GNAT family N-acetyltransferase [Bacteroidales bacterium]